MKIGHEWSILLDAIYVVFKLNVGNRLWDIQTSTFIAVSRKPDFTTDQYGWKNDVTFCKTFPIKVYLWSNVNWFWYGVVWLKTVTSQQLTEKNYKVKLKKKKSSGLVADTTSRTDEQTASPPPPPIRGHLLRLVKEGTRIYRIKISNYEQKE